MVMKSFGHACFVMQKIAVQELVIQEIVMQKLPCSFLPYSFFVMLFPRHAVSSSCRFPAMRFSCHASFPAMRFPRHAVFSHAVFCRASPLHGRQVLQYKFFAWHRVSPRADSHNELAARICRGQNKSRFSFARVPPSGVLYRFRSNRFPAAPKSIFGMT